MEVKFDQANLEAAIIKQAVDTLYDDDRLYEQVKAEINKRVDAALAAVPELLVWRQRQLGLHHCDHRHLIFADKV